MRRELHDTHNEYIIDILDDEYEKLTDHILERIPLELKYSFSRLLEVINEKEKITKLMIDDQMKI